MDENLVFVISYAHSFAPTRLGTWGPFQFNSVINSLSKFQVWCLPQENILVEDGTLPLDERFFL